MRSAFQILAIPYQIIDGSLFYCVFLYLIKLLTVLFSTVFFTEPISTNGNL